MAGSSETLMKIKERIENSLPTEKSGKGLIRLVAVSKTFGVDAIRMVYDFGIRDFGENKVQELLEKRERLPSDIEWHMIGRLQTNKIKEVIGKVALIHSLDRLELFKKMDSELRKKNGKQECLLQVNISGEASKAGFAPDKIDYFLNQIPIDSAVKIVGVMTMAPLTQDVDAIRKIFRAAKNIFEDLKRTHAQLDWKYLSMGMSGDYEIAVEEGSNMVRIGTALFGQRN